jgi:hypothetical protein
MRKVLKRNVAAVVLVVSAAFAGTALGVCPTSYKMYFSDGALMYCALYSSGADRSCVYDCVYKS